MGRRTGRHEDTDLSAVARECARRANALKALGLKQGDVVTIYMPMIPELAISMLACARLGIVHSVVFGGFSAEAVADRNNDAQAKAFITADGVGVAARC